MRLKTAELVANSVDSAPSDLDLQFAQACLSQYLGQLK